MNGPLTPSYAIDIVEVFAKPVTRLQVKYDEWTIILFRMIINC